MACRFLDESATTRCSTTPASSSSRAASCSTPTSTSWSRSSIGACARWPSDMLGRATVGATTPDAFQHHASAAARCRSARAGSTSTACSPRTTAPPTIRRSACSTPCWPSRASPTRSPTPPSPICPIRRRCPTAGRHLVYLDVWDREVTHLEQPDLVESAVGVETSSRLQTVWQVRVLADDAGTGATCALARRRHPRLGGSDRAVHRAAHHRHLRGRRGRPIPASCRRPAAIAGSRTSSIASRSTTPASPAAPPRSSGRARTPASAAASPASSRPPSSSSRRWPRRRAALQHRRLGRDHRRRARVLAGAAARCARITVDEATRRITFTPALPADDAARRRFPTATFPRRAQPARAPLGPEAARCCAPTGSGTTAVFQDLDAAGSTGVITVPAAGTTLLLENGVTVSFASAGAKGFRAGDYWVFAARTADASVEMLDQAPPRGIHHHYARLAHLGRRQRHASPTAATPGRRGRRRRLQLHACVTPESHASGAAHDPGRRATACSETGGTVCLQAGQYALREPVRLSGARSVRIKGQGPATVLVSRRRRVQHRRQRWRSPSRTWRSSRSAAGRSSPCAPSPASRCGIW